MTLQEFKNFFQVGATIMFGSLIIPAILFFSAVSRYAKLADDDELSKSVQSHEDMLDEDRGAESLN